MYQWTLTDVKPPPYIKRVSRLYPVVHFLEAWPPSTSCSSLDSLSRSVVLGGTITLVYLLWTGVSKGLLIDFVSCSHVPPIKCPQPQVCRAPHFYLTLC